MKLLYLLCATLLASILFNSCRKPESKHCNYHCTIIFQCQQENKNNFRGYLDGVELKLFHPGEIGIYSRDTGLHYFQATMDSSSTTYADTVRIGACETALFHFP
ncbi:MAG: hypothetical protein JSS78_03160 [Bacteroidetes bacterium]|nr:hypothetical protein [Bacteroidota bacterium]